MKTGLNIGCGKDYRESTLQIKWYNLDRDPRVKCDLHCNAFALSGLTIGQFDEILAIDILEHCPVYLWKAALNDWCGLLKSNGTIQIQVPSLINIAWLMTNGTIDEATANRVIYGECTSDWDRHYQTFTEDKLTQALQEFGLTIERVSDLHVNIVVVAKKP